MFYYVIDVIDVIVLEHVFLPAISEKDGIKIFWSK